MHKQAAKNTAKLLAAALLASAVVSVAINVVPLDVLLSILGLGVMGYLIHVFYTIEKGRLESLERLNKSVDQ